MHRTNSARMGLLLFLGFGLLLVMSCGLSTAAPSARRQIASVSGVIEMRSAGPLIRLGADEAGNRVDVWIVFQRQEDEQFADAQRRAGASVELHGRHAFGGEYRYFVVESVR